MEVSINFEKCAISSAIREMHIETIVRYNLTPVRMTTIQKPIRNAGEDVEKKS
jgi:hypothetical protein